MSRARGILVLGTALGVSACGLDALLVAATRKENQQETNVFRGSSLLDAPKLRLVLADDSEVDLVEERAFGGTYEIKVAASAFDNVRVVATQGHATLFGLVPHADFLARTDLHLDATSTTLVLLALAKLGPENTTLLIQPPGTMDKFQNRLRAEIDAGGPAGQVRVMVERFVMAADRTTTSTTVQFQTPVLSATYETLTSAINPEWLQKVSVDYDGDGTKDTSSEVFDAALAGVAKTAGFDKCLDPARIRTVFAVNFNAGQKDGNCDGINRFKWVQDTPGKLMYFVGGIHRDSSIQDSAVDLMLGNPGSWTPNTIPMFDDGTHGDFAAGDNVWSISFELPRGMRMGYKYTWGHAGDLWTGTEEWPGNQRILEISDQNGDDYVYRYDNFGDEATNKDKVNLYRRGRGTVTWTTDANADGIPDAAERMVDLDGDCTLDDWVTPSSIGVVTVDCDTLSGT
ncbi:MAG: hypothetical protein HY791_16245 [Deltaproteobacteria bacterium]|nr:hypothetical protein [Deltaproteobacteria bacterium]